MKLVCSQQVFNPQISNFMNICPLGSGLFHADRQTDRHKNDEPNSRYVFNRLNRLSPRSEIQTCIGMIFYFDSS